MYNIDNNIYIYIYKNSPAFLKIELRYIHIHICISEYICVVRACEWRERIIQLTCIFSKSRQGLWMTEIFSRSNEPITIVACPAIWADSAGSSDEEVKEFMLDPNRYCSVRNHRPVSTKVMHTTATNFFFLNQPSFSICAIIAPEETSSAHLCLRLVRPGKYIPCLWKNAGELIILSLHSHARTHKYTQIYIYMYISQLNQV